MIALANLYLHLKTYLENIFIENIVTMRNYKSGES